MNTIVLVLLVLMALGIVPSYFLVFRKWNKCTKFEQIWFSLFWFVVMLLYPVHYIYNKYFVKK